MGTLVFQANLGGAVNLVGPNTASTVNFTLPSADGSSGQALVTNGSGTLSFSSFVSAAAGSNTQVQFNSSGAFAGSANLTFNGTTLTAANTSVTTSETLSYGTANGVAYLNGSKVLTTGSALTFDGTTFANTGVFRKTNSAVAIQSALWGVAQNVVGADNGTAFTLGVDTTTNYGQFQIAFDNLLLGTSSSMRWLLNNGSSTSEQMRLTSTGLGIGTSSPAGPLDVRAANAGGGGGIRLTSTTGTNGVNIKLNNSAGNFYFGIDTSAGGTFGNANAAILWYDAAQPLIFATNNTKQMTLDSSGNLGLGVTPSVYGDTPKLLIYGGASSTSPTIEVSQNGTGVAYHWQMRNGNGIVGWMGSDNTSFVFGTGASTERARIDSSGNLLVGTTSTGDGERLIISKTSADAAIRISNSTSGNSVLRLAAEGVDSGDVYYERSTSRLYVKNSASGGVYLSTNATSWTAVSDERLKTALTPIKNASSKMSTLRAVTGRYKTDTENVSRAFLIAQDVHAVFPEAVNSSNPDELGLQYTDVIPLLVAAIQEQQAIIEQLKARLDAANL